MIPHLSSPSRRALWRRRILRVVAALGLAISAYVHIRIWQHDYRHAPIRELFIAQSVVAVLVAAGLLLALAVSRRDQQLALVAATVAAASLIGFAASRGPGVPTPHGLFKERGLETTQSYFGTLGSAKASLAAETVTVLAATVSLL